MWFVKAFGLLLLLSACTMAGFTAALRLKAQEQKLMQVSLGLKQLKDRIRLDGGELPRLVRESFSGIGTVSEEGGAVILTVPGLDNKDAALLNEYFYSAGMSDAISECDRTELYISLIEGRHAAARKKAAELCRLYQTAGFLTGLFICIFLL